MITLFTFGPAFGLPDPSPFVMKAETLLKMARLPYKVDTGGFGRAPKGKLPYIDEDGAIIADSTLIRCHLEQKHGVDFDAGLGAAERGTAWAFEKMLEDHVYWGVVSERWLDDANFAAGPAIFFKRAPAPIRPIVARMVRRKVAQALKAQGLGRHTRAEMTALVERAIDGVAAFLGDKRYLMGATKCGADATLFAFIAGLLCPIFDTALRGATERHANLVAYRDRMMQEHYPVKAG
jgi:glutathione S-transferase